MDVIIICIAAAIVGFISGYILDHFFIAKRVGAIHVIENSDGTSFWLEIASLDDVKKHQNIILEVRKDRNSHK